MTTDLRKIRDEKYAAQGGRCFYCNQPMWSGSPLKFQTAHSVSQRKARWFQCTAEHLLSASDGGPDTPANIVAACKFCNHNRHRSKQPLSPEAYKLKVLGRMELGGWMRLSS